MTTRYVFVALCGLLLSACGSGVNAGSLGAGSTTLRATVDPAATAEAAGEMTDRVLMLVADASWCSVSEACASVLTVDAPPAIAAAEVLSNSASYLMEDDDAACVDAARRVKEWADVFPAAVEAWQRDVIAGELADGFVLFRAQAQKWPDLPMRLLACT